ncbi:MAG: RNase adapter RapZ [Firmicutes bacterium]|nr:RNase adapter RapZ [Bacillota bacterium]
MDYLIVTGMSGAGRTTCIHALEDLGYYCIDNLPPELIPKTIELWQQTKGIDRAAFGVDIRSRQYFRKLSHVLDELKEKEIGVSIVFLDCRDEELIRRFKTTRREHPLQKYGRKRRMLEDALAEERSYLQPLRNRADYLLDTSDTNIWQSRNRIRQLFGEDQEDERMRLQFVSFGYSRGIPADCDLVFDVRFLPNPHYVESLRAFTGMDPDVQDYVMRDGLGAEFIARVDEMLQFLIPLYEKEGKLQLTVGVGCTGGRHRSVTIAEKLFEVYAARGADAAVYHRDMGEPHKPTG